MLAISINQCWVLYDFLKPECFALFLQCDWPIFLKWPSEHFIVLQRLKAVEHMKSSFSLLTFNANLRSCTENTVQVSTGLKE